MTRQPFVVQPADYPRSLNVVGEHITVLASGTATGGYEIFLRKARKAVARRRTVTLGTSPSGACMKAPRRRLVAGA